MVQPVGSVIEICYVVNDFNAALSYWTTVMDAGPFFAGELSQPGQTYRGQITDVAFKVALGACGPMVIELITPTNNNPSIFREVLDARGEGVHHIMFRTDDYEAEIARYSQAGYEVVCEDEDPGMGRFAMIDTQKVSGGFVEVMDFTSTVIDTLERIERAHQQWDGRTDPVLPLKNLMEGSWVENLKGPQDQNA